MPLTAGARLGPYEIITLLGAGGMGEVYRAKDIKLARDVALKILPPTFTNDPERLARFQREAQVLASLNHPHIGAIYGLDEANGTQFLVLELVDGNTLADRIAKGPLAVDEALAIAKQIAEAVEAAHEQGIIHRDLKPANIALTNDGNVKVLDFGLAKSSDGERSGSFELANSPTIASPATMTGVGMILGTAAYMSPEQSKGRAADKRSDVWAFGCVLYEMLAARRAFGGEDVSDTLASVLAREPDFRLLPQNLAAPVRALLMGCLEKDRRARIPDLPTVRYFLDHAPALAISAQPVPGEKPRRPAWAHKLTLAAAAAAVGTTAAVVWVTVRSPITAKLPMVRFAIVPPSAAAFAPRGVDRDLAVSPDGTRIAYRGMANGEVVLFVRSLDALESVPIRGLNVIPRHPFFSPDGHWLGFATTTALWKVAVTGGPPLKICGISGPPRGASWLQDDSIVFATAESASGLLRVPASGGEPQVLTTPDRQAGEIDHLWPSALPGARGVLFTITTPGSIENSKIAVFDLRTRRVTMLIRGGTSPAYAPSGHLVYATGGTLRAVGFDLARLEVKGDPVPVLDRVGINSFGAAEFDIARAGTLLYTTTGGSARSLALVTRDGREEPLKAPFRAYNYPRWSPDGTRVAIDSLDMDSDIWIWDFARESLTRLTSDPAVDTNPVWTADGRRIVFASTRNGLANLFWQAADGATAAERLVESTDNEYPYATTQDGTGLIFRHDRVNTHEDLDLLTFADRRTRPLVDTTFSEGNADVSPDGRWLTYQSNDSGRDEVYVRPFPDVAARRWQVSAGGGIQPLWSHDGRELFYRDAVGGVMAMRITTSGATLSAGRVTRILAGPYYVGPAARTYDVSRDGKRFLMIKENAGQDATIAPAMIIVLNWLDELKARVPLK